MINQGKCPHCKKTMLHARVEKVSGMVEEESKARCLSFSCIHCNAVLGIQLDARAKRRPKGTKSEAAPEGRYVTAAVRRHSKLA